MCSSVYIVSCRVLLYCIIYSAVCHIADFPLCVIAVYFLLLASVLCLLYCTTPLLCVIAVYFFLLVSVSCVLPLCFYRVTPLAR